MSKLYSLVFFSFILLIAVFAFPSAPALANVQATLPPRPTAVPTATSTPTPIPPTVTVTAVPTVPTTPNATSTSVYIPPQTEGATIILYVTNAPANLQTVVQWRDGLGKWHDVDGWRGTLINSAYIAWWVAPDNFGQGPFRWVATTASGTVWGTSNTFTLPASTGQITHVYLPAQ